MESYHQFRKGWLVLEFLKDFFHPKLDLPQPTFPHLAINLNSLSQGANIGPFSYSGRGKNQECWRTDKLTGFLKLIIFQKSH